MTGKDMGPSGEYITMSLLNEHIIKLTSKYLYFTHRPGAEEFLSAEVDGSQRDSSWLKCFKQMIDEYTA